jgi:hypothetical protein
MPLAKAANSALVQAVARKGCMSSCSEEARLAASTCSAHLRKWRNLEL